MMLALTPELVDMVKAEATTGYATFARAPEHLSFLGPIAFTWVTADVSAIGGIGDPSRASVERGEEIVELSVEKIVRALEEISGRETALGLQRTRAELWVRGDLLALVVPAALAAPP